MSDPVNQEPSGSPVSDRAAEAAARIALGLVPILGPALAEAVGFARGIHDDREATAFRAEVRRRLTELESHAPTPGTRVTLSGDRVRLFDYLVRRGGEVILRGVESADSMEALSLTADDYREAARELEALGLVELDGNANDPSGIARAAVHPWVFVQEIGRVDPSIDVAHELGLVLRVLKSAGTGTLVGRDAFARLGIPVPRLQVLTAFLEERGLAIFRPPGFDGWMFYDAEVTPMGWRVLRGDQDLLSSL